MNDTERSLRDIARLHNEIMRERAEGLHEAAQNAKARLVEREEALVRLRTQVSLLKRAGLTPHDTCGPTPSTSMVTSRSNCAPGSLGRSRQ